MSSFLSNRTELKFVVFCGKGGVGKTTVASTTAVYLAKKEPIKKILLISTDPAHSLADSFDVSPTQTLFALDSLSNLHVLQIDSERVLKEFKQEYGDAIKTLALRGTYLDQEDVDLFFSLSLPGLDEVMAITTVMKYVKEGAYGLIVLDTAPTGHFIRMLSSPIFLGNWAKAMDSMQAKHRYMASRFRRGPYRKDRCDQFLEEMARDTRALWALFMNTRSTEFIPVLIPEAMSLLETEDLLATLKEYKIPTHGMVVNRVQVEESCPFCRRRKESQAKDIESLGKKFPSHTVRYLPLFDHEVKTKTPNFTRQFPVSLQYRYLPKKYSTESGVHIFGDYVITYTGLTIGKIDENVVFFVIHSKNLAESYRKWFWYMWEQSSEDIKKEKKS